MNRSTDPAPRPEDPAPAADRQEREFRQLETLARDTIGVRLFTVSRVDLEQGVAVRCYSSMPDAYPVSGKKPIPDNAWTQQVLVRREVFVANRIEDIAAVFPDHALIRSLGCESCLNLPVVLGQTVAGTLNLLHEAEHFTPERVERARQLQPPAVLAFSRMAAR